MNIPLVRRRGFTLVEVVTTVAIMAIIAAATIPTIRGKLQTSEAGSLVSELQGIRTAIQTYKQDVGRYPDSLYYLSALPGTPLDGCGGSASNTLTVPRSAGYRGPYFNRAIAAADKGYQLYTGDTVLNKYGPDSVLLGQGAGPRDAIEIVVLGVDTTVAKLVDQAVDGTVSATTGLLAYGGTSATAPFDTLKYLVPIYPMHC